MKGSKRNRPYVRSATPLASRPAEQLATSAGLARPSLEQLESRQMLFSLTITPESGGTVTTQFGYTIPYLFYPDDIDDADPPDPVLEDFNDEGGMMGVGVGPVGSGTVFNESNIRIDHNIIQPANIRLRAPNPDEPNEIEMFVRPSLGEQFSLRFYGDDANTAFVGVNSLSIDVRAGDNSNVGLPIFDNMGNAIMTVDLIFQGEVISSFSGNALAALDVSGNPQPGLGTFLFETEFGAVTTTFDEVVFSFEDGPNDPFVLDNFQYQEIDPIYKDLIVGRIFGAEIVFQGPVGATVQVLDLYGRDMRNTLALGMPANLEVALVDLDGNGVPEFNDGIGQILFSDVDENTSFSIVGGTITFDNEQGFIFNQITALNGLFNEFEAAGFGFFPSTDDGEDIELVGLPPASGSVIVGSPFVRDNSSQFAYNVEGFADPNLVVDDPVDFNRADQGVKVLDQNDIGTVNIHGVLFGSSDFSGYANNLWVGYLLGSVSVAGDLGSLVVATDAGLWVADPDSNNPNIVLDAVYTTGAELVVGRTVGEIAIAGRSILNVVVGGNLNEFDNNPPRDVLRYDEREVMSGISFDSNIEAVVAAYSAGGYGLLTPVFGNGTFRNDSILSAEFVSNSASAVEILGSLGGGDPVNTFEDRADVYAFVADGTQQVLVENFAASLMQIRIVDQDGRTLAANEFPVTGEEDLSDFVRLTFTPDMPGIYYLVVQGDPGITTDGDAGSSFGYLTTITGMAAVSLGSYRTAGNSGAASEPDAANTVSVLSGAVGSMRIGTGYSGSGGGEQSPASIFNTEEEEDDNLMDFRGGTFSFQGNLYNITTGSDFGEANFFEPINIFVGGDLGTIVTGLSPLVGQSPFEGDLGVVNLQVNGSIAMLDIRGGIGVDQDVDDPETDLAILPPDSTNISVGLDADGPVEIGMIRVGSRVFGPAFNLSAPNGTIIGAFLVDQDSGIDPAGQDNTGIMDEAPAFLTGAGSDVRFVHFNQIDGVTVDETTPLALGAPVEFTDDGGGLVQISITGGNGNLNSLVRVLPIDQSEGVAIAEIVVDLTGGGSLNIMGLTNQDSTDVISIGKILIIGAAANSSISITGMSEIDIWMIEQQGGAAFNSILNQTPGGDIVAIDVVGLNTLEITEGKLGRTQVPTWGPKLIGPFLGIAAGAGGAVGGTIGIGGTMEPNWGGATYRPVNDVAQGTIYLDDIGSPVDPFLDGIIVRTDDLLAVQVSDEVGDVIVSQGNLIQLTANFGDDTPFGEFHGIVGTIYANSINTVDIGDGLAQRAQSPLSSTGIFANTDILLVHNPGNDGAFISSTILAAAGDFGNNPIGVDLNPDVLGLGTIMLTNGDYVDAYIGSQLLDDFWTSVFFPGSDPEAFKGSIINLTSTNGDFIRSELTLATLPSFRLDGFFDASFIEVAGDAQFIEATGFRNSTIDGGDLEFRFNVIEIGGNLTTLRTTQSANPLDPDPVGVGDMIDLRVDVLGSILSSITANNFTRVDLDVDGTITLMQANNNIRASSVTAGQLLRADADENIRTSTFNISGPIINLNAADNITNTRIAVTGPDGRIDLIETAGLLSGEFSASGPITTIRSTAGDINARIVTTTKNGNVNLLEAARDLDIETDISGTLNMLQAGRHIGNLDNPSVILVRSDVSMVQAGGQLYSDLRIGGGLTGSVTLGPVIARPNNDLVGGGDIIAFERINLVDVVGDFGGSVISYSGGIGTVRVTDGTFRQGGIVAAYDGSLDLLHIIRGHLQGDVHADINIESIFVEASGDGVFGDIGINPNLSTGVAADGLRNQLPPGAVPNSTIQGPTITAGEKINSIITTDGSMYEATIFAGTLLAYLEINGDLANDNQTIGEGSVIASGNKIRRVIINGSASDAIFIAGATDFGADGRPGGTGTNADLVKRGFIQKIDISGDGENLVFTSGLTAGNDGIYNTGDDLVAFGKSRTNRIQIGGTIDNVSAYSDAFSFSGGNVSNGIDRSGTRRPVDDPQIAPGIPAGATLIPVGTTFTFSYAGGSGTITLTDSDPAPATGAYWDASTGTLTIIKTDKNSDVLVTSDSGTLNNFDIVSNDDSSLGSLTIAANLTGDSDIIFDNKIRDLVLQDVSGSGTIRAGGNIRTITMGNFFGGEIVSHYTRDLTINGTVGSPFQSGEASISLISVENVLVTGDFHGDINISRYHGLFQDGTLTINGTMRRGLINVADSGAHINIGEMVESRITVGDVIDSVNIVGDMFDSAIIAGADLGLDTLFGGTGLDADIVSNGHIGDVTVGGDFIESDLIAGVLRGPDGFYGTGDDSVAEGRSTIGNISIAGDAIGSNLGSESFRITATGTIESVDVDGDEFTSLGNLAVDRLETQPLQIGVTELRVSQESFIYTGEIRFNQNMNSSTIGDALTVSEVRGNGQVTITLDEGADYIVEYDQETFTAKVIFSQAITNRDLPQVGDEPGPGVYRFTLDQDILRAQLVNTRLDGDSNGFAEAGDDYSADDIVGDAGDKLVAETIDATDESGDTVSIDFYNATDLNAVMDDNFFFDGLPDANEVFRLRGFLGDHPDSDVDVFSFSSDVDLYKITLQAGQILRLGEMSGGAQFAARAVLDDQGNPLMATTRENFSIIDFFGGASPFDELPIAQFASDTLAQRGTVTPEMTRLPNNPLSGDDLTTEDVFHIRQTGVYYLAVTNTDLYGAGEVANITTVPGGTGTYAFDIEIFDDGDSGFGAPTDAGNGTRVVNAPAAISFAGPDGVFGTGDDASSLKLGSFTFTLDAGADGLIGTGDDIVTGDNGSGITSSLTGGVMTSVIDSAIGTANFAGVPGNVFSDVDVYHLNAEGLIAPGTNMRVTVRLTDLGADLGSRTQGSLIDFSGNVQFALFDTYNADNSIDDANLVFAPSDFRPSGQTPGVIADDGQTSYGYDDRGDFFVEFLTPGRLGADGLEASTYALYLQGAFNTDYQIEIVTSGTGQVVQSTQNVLLELNGGSIDWLEAGGRVTQLGEYTTSVVGFSGKIDFQDIDDIIIENLVDNLESMFAAAGVAVTVSTNPADFEFQDFSTVFLTRSNDPINFFASQFYGASEHVDVLNADRNDEAVVYVPTMATLGLTPGTPGIEQFSDSLTAAVGRRIGELLGLRAEAPTTGFGGTVNVQASNSVEVFGDDLSYRFSTVDQTLSNGYDTLNDTIFFMGRQNATSLLDRILAE